MAIGELLEKVVFGCRAVSRRAGLAILIDAVRDSRGKNLPLIMAKSLHSRAVSRRPILARAVQGPRALLPSQFRLKVVKSLVGVEVAGALLAGRAVLEALGLLGGPL